MAIVINQNTRYLIQGITGKEGTRAAEWMVKLGSQVVAGVTPGKGGQTISGLIDKTGAEIDPIPVYETVEQAVQAQTQVVTAQPQAHKEIDATCIYVPPRFVLGAAKEAISAGIPLIHIIAENVPTRDTVTILELAQAKSQEIGKQIRIIGPSSIGVMSPGKSVMGSLGAGSDEGLLAPFSQTVSIGKAKGGVVVLAKSGGMSLTISQMLSQEGVAISTIVGLGGDKISCTTYADLLDDIAKDDETWAVVLIGEIGGSYEEDFAQAIQETGFKKPVTAFISGTFAENLPAGVAFGHAGAIVSRQFGTRVGKITALKNAGVLIADDPEDIVELLKQQE